MRLTHRLYPEAGCVIVGGIALHGRTSGAARGYRHLALSGQKPFSAGGRASTRPYSYAV